MSWLDIDTAASIAEIFGGVAILVSLAYVGYQIRQSNRIASASALQSVLDRYSDRTVSQYVEQPETSVMLARGHCDYHSLSIEERVIFDAWQLREVLQMQNVMQLYKQGLLEHVDYETWLAFTVAQVTTPGGMVSWTKQRPSLTPTIVATVDSYISQNPEAPSLIDLYPDVYLQK